MFLYVLEIHENPKVDFVASASKIQRCHPGRHNCLHRRGVWGKMWTYVWWDFNAWVTGKCEKSVSSSDREDDCKADPWSMWWPQRPTTRPQSINNSFGVSVLFLRLGLVLCEGGPFIGQHLEGCCSQIIRDCKTFVLPNKKMMLYCYMLDPPPTKWKFIGIPC